MSPSLRERLVVGLSPAGVQLARYSRGLRPRLAERATAHCAETGPEPWRSALETLARELPRHAAAHPVCEVVLSNHFVRYQVLPWRPELGGREEREALAHAQYRSVFGEAAQQWDVRLEDARFGASTLACAADRSLIEELGGLLKTAGVRPTAIEPYLAAAFNRWRHKLKAPPFWLVLLEPGRLWVGLMGATGWSNVSARRLSADVVDETRAVLAQEAALSAADAAPAYLIAAGLDRESARDLREGGIEVLATATDALLSLDEAHGIR